jgi:hypothetical protein
MENSKIYTKLINETFTIQKAINRIVWRFKNENVKVNESKIIINTLDQLAINEIENYFKSTENIIFKNNEAFAKLFAYTLKQEILYFNDVKIAVKNLCQKLELPLDYHFDEIVFLSNQLVLEKQKEKLGLNKRVLKMNKEEIIKLKHEIKNNKELQKNIVGFWSAEKIYNSLKNTINNILLK